MIIDKSRISLRDAAFLVSVPKRGLEPPRAYTHYTLNVARLPIPPFGQMFVWHAFQKRIAR